MPARQLIQGLTTLAQKLALPLCHVIFLSPSLTLPATKKRGASMRNEHQHCLLGATELSPSLRVEAFVFHICAFKVRCQPVPCLRSGLKFFILTRGLKPTLLSPPAAVHVQCLPGHVARQGAAEEQDHVGDFSGSPNRPSGISGSVAPGGPGSTCPSRSARRPARPGVDGDPVGELAADDVGERDDAGFRRGIVRLAEGADHRR